MELNLQNIEEILFFDKKVQALLPEFHHLFNQWRIGKMTPGMSGLAKRSVAELLSSLSGDHLPRLSEYFGDIITLDKIDPHLARHHDAPLEDPGELCRHTGFKDFAVTRDGRSMSITFWR